MTVEGLRFVRIPLRFSVPMDVSGRAAIPAGCDLAVTHDGRAVAYLCDGRAALDVAAFVAAVEAERDRYLELAAGGRLNARERRRAARGGDDSPWDDRTRAVFGRDAARLTDWLAVAREAGEFVSARLHERYGWRELDPGQDEPYPHLYGPVTLA